MFEKKYINFKKNMLKKTFENEQDSFFEKTSIGTEPMFALNEFFTKEYIYGNTMIDTNFLAKSEEEIASLKSKMAFVKGYLEDYYASLQARSEALDSEFYKLQSIISLKGNSITSMYEYLPSYSNVGELETVYLHNCIEDSSTFTKTAQEESLCKTYLSYSSSNSATFTLEEPKYISEVLLEFSKTMTYNLYGRKVDGTLEAIATDVRSDKTISVSPATLTEYTELVLYSFEDISKYFSKIYVFAVSEDTDTNKKINAYILHKFKPDESISSYSVFSTSETTVFNIAGDEVLKLVSDLKALTNREIFETYCNGDDEVAKGEEYIFDGDILYFLEVVPVDIRSVEKLKVFGKEVE